MYKRSSITVPSCHTFFVDVLLSSTLSHHVSTFDVSLISVYSLKRSRGTCYQKKQLSRGRSTLELAIGLFCFPRIGRSSYWIIHGAGARTVCTLRIDSACTYTLADTRTSGTLTIKQVFSIMYRCLDISIHARKVYGTHHRAIWKHGKRKITVWLPDTRAVMFFHVHVMTWWHYIGWFLNPSGDASTN